MGVSIVVKGTNVLLCQCIISNVFPSVYELERANFAECLCLATHTNNKLVYSTVLPTVGQPLQKQLAWHTNK